MPKKSAVWSNVLPTKQTGLTTVIRRFEEISAAKLLKTRDEITGKKTKQNKTKQNKSARRVACKFDSRETRAI